MVQSLLEVLKMSVAERLSVKTLLIRDLDTEASIVSHVPPKRLVCMSPVL